MSEQDDRDSLPAVLVVDDTRANLLAMRVVLKPLPLRVVEVASGPEALAALQEQDFAVVLLDVQMPEMDGYEVAERMRQESRTERTPIIFVTASHAELMQKLRGYQVGAVDYIGKPLEEEILRSKVGFFLELYTMRERLERQMRETEALNEELRAAQETLVRDIMRPLNDIRAVAFKAAVKQADELDQTWVHRLQRVADNSQRMVDTLTELMQRGRPG